MVEQQPPAQAPAPTRRQRGAFILLEGGDRCGKTTQAQLLRDALALESFRFPNRATAIGQQLGAYLASASTMNDHVAHLLFSANRWESRDALLDTLRSGQSLVT